MVVHVKNRIIISLSLVLLVAIVGLNFYASSDLADSTLFEQFLSTSGNADVLTGAVVGTTSVPSEIVEIQACSAADYIDSFDGGPAAMSGDFSDPPVQGTMADSGNEIVINGTLLNSNLSDDGVSASFALFMDDSMPVDGDFNLSVYINVSDTSSTFLVTGGFTNLTTIRAGLLLQDIDADELIHLCELVIASDDGGLTALFPTNDSTGDDDSGAVILGGIQELAGNLSANYDSAANEFNCSFTSNLPYASSVMDFDLSLYSDIRAGIYSSMDLSGPGDPTILMNGTLTTLYNDFAFTTDGACAVPAAPVTDFVEDFNDAINTSLFTPEVVGSPGISLELINNEASFNGSIASLTGSNGFRLYTAGAVSNNNQSSTVYVNFTRTNETYQAGGTINQVVGIEYFNSGADDYFAQCALNHNGNTFGLYLWNDSGEGPAAGVPLAFSGTNFVGNLTFEYENTSNYMNCSFRLNATVTLSASALRDSAMPPGTGIGLITSFLPQGPFSYNASANVTFENFVYNGSADVNIAVPAAAPPAPDLVSFFEDFDNALNVSFFLNISKPPLVVQRNNSVLLMNTSVTADAQQWGRLYGSDSLANSGFITSVNFTMMMTNDSLANDTGIIAGIELMDTPNDVGSMSASCRLQAGTDGNIFLLAFNSTGATNDGIIPVTSGYTSGLLTFVYDNAAELITCSYLDSLGTTYTASNGYSLGASTKLSLIGGMTPIGSPPSYDGDVITTFENWNFTDTYTAPAAPGLQPLTSFYDIGGSGINTSFYSNETNGVDVVFGLFDGGGSSGFQFSNTTLVNRIGPSSGTLKTIQNISGGPSFSLSAALYFPNLTNTYSTNGTLASVWTHAQLGLQQSGSNNNNPYCSLSRSISVFQLRVYNASNSPAQNFTDASVLLSSDGNYSNLLKFTYDNQTNLLNCSIGVAGPQVTAKYDLSAAGDTHEVFLGATLGIEGPGGSSDNYSLAVNMTFNNLNFTITPLAIVCGNGVQQTGEQCDDGNTLNFDGCSSSCQDESVGGGDFAGCFSCGDNGDQSSCETPSGTNCNGGCSWDSSGSFCKQPSCELGVNSNLTYCQTTLNSTFGILCSWDNSSGGNDCFGLGGDFFGNGCSDFTETQCQDIPSCLWNTTDCTQDTARSLSQGNPSCGILPTQDLCINVSGCSWSGSSCSGNDEGIQCSDFNRTICSGAPILSSCCAWSSGACSESYATTCYDEIESLPVGATSCNDYNAFTNQTVCNQIASAPYYMPCSWENTTQKCNFNSAAYGGAGGSSSFDEIGSETSCEAQGGVWKTEQWINTQTGSTQTDSWCEFNYGSQTGNCDSTCWNCEYENDGSVWSSSAAAESACSGSDLGYCEFRADSNAFNGYGFCNPKQDFIEAGGKSCDDECSACDFLVNPETQCGNSAKGCTFENDSTADNGVGFCYGGSEKRCSTDCFSCYTQNDCTVTGDGGAGACVFDSVNFYCKPTGYTDEICFDGSDNDNDNKVDCLDSGCSTDKFCGGAELGDSFGNDCPSFTSQGNATCVSNGCVWSSSDFDSEFGGAGAGFCDFPGSQCWQSDDDQSACNAISGCTYLSESLCDMNMTLGDACFSQRNLTACDSVAPTGACSWVSDPGLNGGHCEPIFFSQCFANSTRQQSQAACEINATIGGSSTQICGWGFDPYGGQVGCMPLGFTQTAATCSNTTGLFEVVDGICESDSFGGKCIQADGNQSWCEGTLNQSCTWFTDVNANNNVSAGNNSGWCDPLHEGAFNTFMGDIEPEFIGLDENEGPINDNYDIEGLGIRDTFDKLVFGTRLYNKFNNSITCNGVPTYTTGAVGVGQDNYTFFWYMDTDGDTTNGCSARDNSSLNGFEFSFMYKASVDSPITETKVSYQCIGGSWGAVPIPLSSSSQKMCDVIGGGMVGIDKNELLKFKTLFNKSKDLRIYATVGNNVRNNSQIIDSIDPTYYSPGAMDFKFEDCGSPGGDFDGDGIIASNDPDCTDFQKFGFVPVEAGFLCGDGIDNNANGLTDCSDQGCEFSFECGGTGIPIASAGDTKAPKIVWLERNTYPDGALVRYDSNEPSNGTLQFYYNDSTCKTLNKTIRDYGVIDPFVPAYKLKHEAPIDNNGNLDALGYSLTNATTYYFKTKVCDINSNCAVSACLNLTTKNSFASCSSCSTTFNFPFTPGIGFAQTEPLGNMQFTFELSGGSQQSLNSTTGTQLNYSSAKNFNFVIQNPTATIKSYTKLINATFTGKMSSDVGNFTDAVQFNSTSSGKFVGLGNTKCQQLINSFRPKKLEMGIPGNNTDLWQCNGALNNCTNKTSSATRVSYNVTTNITAWQVPAEWGC
jgi:hypothetical protein